MCSDTGIATHGSKIPGCASLVSLFREEQKNRAVIFPFGQLWTRMKGNFFALAILILVFSNALPLPTAGMIRSGTTNLTQISGHLWGGRI